jgi:hypothetical protein
MNKSENQQFETTYRKFETGSRVEALRELRELASKLKDPSDRLTLLYNEILFLLEMNKVLEARLRLATLGTVVATLGELPPDSSRDDAPTNLAVMVRYTELRVLFAEGNEPEALRVLEGLLGRYPKQLSIPGFRRILNEIETHHGLLLADAGRWPEAKPALERASPPVQWRSVVCWCVVAM